MSQFEHLQNYPISISRRIINGREVEAIVTIPSEGLLELDEVDELIRVCNEHKKNIETREINFHNESVFNLWNGIMERAKECKSANQNFVYLMRDNSNGLIKIGISKNPKCREATLQSEKPSIDLIWKTESGIDYEKGLHEKFKDKRVRGEWFSLTKEDILEITGGLA